MHSGPLSYELAFSRFLMIHFKTRVTMATARGISNSIRLKKPCVLLIVIAGMERFAFKGVASNLVTYLTDVAKLTNSTAAKIVNLWCGFTSITPLFAAPLADYFNLDCYTTVLVSSILYVAGLVALTSTTLASGAATSMSMLFLSLSLISLGQGGYNPSLQAFGVDQLVEEQGLRCSSVKDDDDHQRARSRRGLSFTWWYFGVCTGCLLGVSIMSFIQDNWGWSLGFAIPTIVMATSVILFSWWSSFYMYNRRGDVDPSDLFHCAAVPALKDAATRIFKFIVNKLNRENTIYAAELEFHEKSNPGFRNIEELEENPKCLIEKAKVVLHLLPVWASLLIFAVIFQQPPTFFTKQGMTMKRNIGSRFHIQVPPATLQSAMTITIIILMPLYDKLLVPLMRMITRYEKGITAMQRMGFGMFLSTIAMVIAAVVEEHRLHNTRKLGSETPSIFWLLPQYVLLGISDIFTVVGMQEFFYGEVPVNMRTMGIALNTSVFGVGSFLSALLISAIELFTGSTFSPGKDGWFSDDLKEARLDKYFWLLAGLSAFSLLMYITFYKYYRNANDSSVESCK